MTDGNLPINRLFLNTHQMSLSSAQLLRVTSTVKADPPKSVISSVAGIGRYHDYVKSHQCKLNTKSLTKELKTSSTR